METQRSPVEEKYRPPSTNALEWALLRAALKLSNGPVAVDIAREDLLQALHTRALPVSDAVRERISGCTDRDTLIRWRDRVWMAIDAAEDMFVEDEAETGPA